jgi:hypothetical protein
LPLHTTRAEGKIQVFTLSRNIVNLYRSIYHSITRNNLRYKQRCLIILYFELKYLLHSSLEYNIRKVHILIIYTYWNISDILGNLSSQVANGRRLTIQTVKTNIIIAFLYPTALQVNTFALVYPPPPPPLEFTVDHPFIAFIVDDVNKFPLFVCRVTDPTVLQKVKN